MKVFDLQCLHQHVFEGWFASEDDYLMQCERSQIECPFCGDLSISKRLSAPRLNLGANVPIDSAHASVASDQPATNETMQGRWLTAARRILATIEDVGTDFSREARKIHYGEVPERAIRGSATRAETESLLDEGIPVLPIALPDVFKKTLQ